jgi:hypothetical protein
VNGKVYFTRRINLGNYEHKEFSAEISFSEEETIDTAADLAVETVETRLGLRKVAQVLKAAGEEAAPKKSKIGAFIEAVEAADVAQAAADAAAAEVGALDEPIIVDSEPVVGEPVVGEPIIVEPVVGEPIIVEPVVGEARRALAAAASEEGDPLADRVVDNDELYRAVQAFIMKHGARGKIAVIGMLLGYAEQLAAIPEERRLAFLAELAGLTP